MAVVADSTAIIGLHAIGKLDLLRQIFGAVVIPPAVQREIKADLPAWITVHAPVLSSLRLPAQLGDGEREAIQLARDIGAEAIVLDDLLARRAAQQLGLPLTGVMGILLAAKAKGLLSAVKPEMDALRAATFRISEPLYETVLAHVGELPGETGQGSLT